MSFAHFLLFYSLNLKQFDQAVEDVKNLKTSPNNDDLLEIYAFYKQATVGNVNTSKLTPLFFVNYYRLQLVTQNIEFTHAIDA